MAGNLFGNIAALPINYFGAIGSALADVPDAIRAQRLARQQALEAEKAQQALLAQIASGIQPESTTPAQPGVSPQLGMNGQVMSLPDASTGTPAQRSGVPNLDRVRAGLAQGAVMKGDFTGANTIMNADIKTMPDGTILDGRTGQVVGRVPQRSYVNGFNVDPSSPNAPGFLPQIMPNGEPLYDPRGNIAGQQLLSGTEDALRRSSQAETLGRTAGTVFNNPVGPGQTQPTLGMEMFGIGGAPIGGAGAMPTPPGAPPLPGRPSLPPRRGAGITDAPAAAGATAYAEQRAKDSIAKFTEIQNSGDAANNTRQTIHAMTSLLDGWQGGTLAPTALQLSSFAQSFGIKMDPKMSAAQAADAISKQMALQLRNPASGAGMPGSMSNQDRNYLSSMIPNLMQSPEGRKQLAQYYDIAAERAQQRAMLARQWQDKAGRIDAPDRNGKHFEDYWNLYLARHPLFAPRR